MGKIKHAFSSLRSKRFRGVWEQRKSEERDFKCFSRAKNGARAKKRKRGWRRGSKRFLPSFPSPSLSPSFLFLALAHFSRWKNGKNLLPNPTETLATQATLLGQHNCFLQNVKLLHSRHFEIQSPFYFC